MVTKINPAKNGFDAINYIKGGKRRRGHNGLKDRNLLLMGLNLMPETYKSYEAQMGELWDRMSENHKVQGRRIIVSFSDKELDPKDENRSAQIAMDIGAECVSKFYPDRQTVLAVQKDGKSGLIHVHIFVSDCSLIDLKGCTKEQTNFNYVEKNFDKVAKEHFDKLGIKFDYGQKTKNKKSSFERNKDQKNHDRYSWEEDIKGRITKAMSEAISREDFVNRLKDMGVDADIRDNVESRLNNIKKRISSAIDKSTSPEDMIKRFEKISIDAEFHDPIKGDFEDFKEFIKGAINEATSREDIFDKFRSMNIDAEFRYKSKRHDSYICYTLNDYSNFENEKDYSKYKQKDGTISIKIRSGRMGDDFDLEELDRRISMNKKAAVKSRSVSSGDNTGTNTGKSSEEQHDLYLQFMFMQTVGMNVKGLPPEETNRIVEEGKKRWKDFKDAYPDDYEKRLYNGDVSLPSTDKEEPPAVTVPASETVLTDTPAIQEPEKKPEKLDVNRLKEHAEEKRNRWLEKTKGDAPLVEEYDKKYGLDGYDPDWRKNRKGGRDDLQ